jgi:hypothetical protein
MDVKDISPENIARAVNGTVERDGSILCCCPIHEASGQHTPSLVLTITNTRRILFHCRSQNCDEKHFQEIYDYLVKHGLPHSQVGGNRADKEARYTYQYRMDLTHGPRPGLSPSRGRSDSAARCSTKPRSNGQVADRKGCRCCST